MRHSEAAQGLTHAGAAAEQHQPCGKASKLRQDCGRASCDSMHCVPTHTHIHFAARFRSGMHVFAVVMPGPLGFVLCWQATCLHTHSPPRPTALHTEKMWQRAPRC